MNLLEQLEAEQVASLGKIIPDFKAGDTIRVGYKIIEGSRSRVQNFEGVCIARKGGHGIGAFLHRAKNLFWRRRRACVSAALHEYREHRSCPPRQSSSCEALLPAVASR